MSGWIEYRARIERERTRTVAFEEVTWQALAGVLGERPLVPIGPPDAILGTLVSFVDDHQARLPRLACLGIEAERLIERVQMRAPHSLSPAKVLRLALEITEDGFRALMICHLAMIPTLLTRALVHSGGDAPTFSSRHALDQRTGSRA